MSTSALRTFFRHSPSYYKLPALITVICRDSVSPPDLSGNTPVTDILQPVQVNLVKSFRNETEFTRFDCIDGRFCQFFHLYKPLLLNKRFYRCMTAVMGSYIMRMRYYLYQISLFLQVFYHCFSCLISVHTCILAAILLIDGSIIIHNIDFRQIVTLSNLKVIRVMCRSNLNCTCSEFFVYIIICHNWNLSVSQRKQTLLAYDIFISLIIRMYCNGSISQHGFRTGSCDLQIIIRSDNWILNMPEISFLLLMLYLCI